MQNSITALVGIHGKLNASLPEDERYAHVNVNLEGNGRFGNDLTFVVWESDEAIQAARDLADALRCAALRAATNLARRRDEERKRELAEENRTLRLAGSAEDGAVHDGA